MGKMHEESIAYNHGKGENTFLGDFSCFRVVRTGETVAIAGCVHFLPHMLHFCSSSKL